jgi:hypothetical protein
MEELKELERRVVDAERRAARQRGASEIPSASAEWSFLIGE